MMKKNFFLKSPVSCQLWSKTSQFFLFLISQVSIKISLLSVTVSKYIFTDVLSQKQLCWFYIWFSFAFNFNKAQVVGKYVICNSIRCMAYCIQPSEKYFICKFFWHIEIRWSALWALRRPTCFKLYDSRFVCSDWLCKIISLHALVVL